MKRILVAAIALVVLLGACSSASGDAASKRDSSNSTTTPASKTQTVTISAKGFTPYWLVVALKHTVTFHNATATAQQIVFDNARDANGAPIQSPPIEPGKSWVWTADTFASFAYHSPQLPGVDGRIQVDPPAEP